MKSIKYGLLVVGFMLAGHALVSAIRNPEFIPRNLQAQSATGGSECRGIPVESDATDWMTGMSIQQDGRIRSDWSHDAGLSNAVMRQTAYTSLGLPHRAAFLKVTDGPDYSPYNPMQSGTTGKSTSTFTPTTGQSIVDGTVRPKGDFPRFRYGPKRGPSLPGKGDILSEVVCADPLTKQICRRMYEQFPGAVWRYQYYSMTQQQAAADAARQFARRNGGFVQREGATYVVYRALEQCSYEIVGCNLLKN